MTRPFRFGVVAPLRTDLSAWLAGVRRIADSGYATEISTARPSHACGDGRTRSKGPGAGRRDRGHGHVRADAEIGFSYFVVGTDFAEKRAPVVAKLAGQ